MVYIVINIFMIRWWFFWITFWIIIFNDTEIPSPGLSRASLQSTLSISPAISSKLLRTFYVLTPVFSWSYGSYDQNISTEDIQTTTELMLPFLKGNKWFADSNVKELKLTNHHENHQICIWIGQDPIMTATLAKLMVICHPV